MGGHFRSSLATPGCRHVLLSCALAVCL
jgi:hypothetical protein